MKLNLKLLFILFVTPLITTPLTGFQGEKVLVLYGIKVSENISSELIKGNLSRSMIDVFNSLCKDDFVLRRNHDWMDKDKSDVQRNQLELEIREIILALQSKSIAPNDKAKLEKYKKLVTTDYVLTGDLLRNPANEVYTLSFTLIDFYSFHIREYVLIDIKAEILESASKLSQAIQNELIEKKTCRALEMDSKEKELTEFRGAHPIETFEAWSDLFLQVEHLHLLVDQPFPASYGETITELKQDKALWLMYLSAKEKFYKQRILDPIHTRDILYQLIDYRELKSATEFLINYYQHEVKNPEKIVFDRLNDQLSLCNEAIQKLEKTNR